MKVIVKRPLKDYDAWLPVVNDRNPMRRDYGSRGGTVYRSARDPNEVYVVFDWDDQKPVKAYFDHPDVQKALSETGTTEIIEVADSFTLDD
jgi:quinol monooxygenase YgiN